MNVSTQSEDTIFGDSLDTGGEIQVSLLQRRFRSARRAAD